MTHQLKIAKYSVKCVKMHDGDLDDPRLFARLNEDCFPRCANNREAWIETYEGGFHHDQP